MRDNSFEIVTLILCSCILGGLLYLRFGYTETKDTNNIVTITSVKSEVVDKYLDITRLCKSDIIKNKFIQDDLKKFDIMLKNYKEDK